ncbi:MAG: hypothetical protein NTX50_13030 [Candidatus Sumerlaeota bacterium]|nr:hypothetical protein [Candidatus Sumerlaeota bacterium]
MSAESEFIQRESQHLLSTISLIEDLLVKEPWSRYEIIAMGTLLQNIHMGIENICVASCRALT